MEKLIISHSKITLCGFDESEKVYTISFSYNRIIIYPRVLNPSMIHFPLDFSNSLTVENEEAADFIRFFLETDKEEFALSFSKLPIGGNYISEQQKGEL